MNVKLAKRRFIDLHVFSNLSIGSSSIDEIAQMAVELGYRAVGLADFNKDNLNLIEDLRRKFSEYGLDLISRVDLNCSSPSELKRKLRFYRRKVEIISVFCRNLQIARLAARDRRVDLLNFTYKSRQFNFFDASEASLSLKGETALEINLRDLLFAGTSGERIQFFKICRENVKLAKKHGVPLVFSSGARSILEMRGPRELAAVASLLDLTEFEARETLSTIPFNIVQRNREKLNENFILPGVRRIRGEIDW